MAKKFAFVSEARIDGVSSGGWVPAHGGQVTIEAFAQANGWNVRGKIDYASGSRWYSNDEYMVYVEYGRGGRINHANKGPANASHQAVEKIAGKDKLGQIIALLSGDYKKELVS